MHESKVTNRPRRLSLRRGGDSACGVPPLAGPPPGDEGFSTSRQVQSQVEANLCDTQWGFCDLANVGDVVTIACENLATSLFRQSSWTTGNRIC